MMLDLQTRTRPTLAVQTLLSLEVIAWVDFFRSSQATGFKSFVNFLSALKKKRRMNLENMLFDQFLQLCFATQHHQGHEALHFSRNKSYYEEWHLKGSTVMSRIPDVAEKSYVESLLHGSSVVTVSTMKTPRLCHASDLESIYQLYVLFPTYFITVWANIIKILVDNKTVKHVFSEPLLIMLLDSQLDPAGATTMIARTPMIFTCIASHAYRKYISLNSREAG